jgi:oligopeptide/dipeptide ABC transporter ATP-binding protein
MTAATSGTEVEPLLQIEGLRVEFVSKLGTVRAVDGISYAVAPGETLAVVGESGCGKSVTALSVIGLVPSPPGVVTAGEIRFAGEDLRSVDADRMRAIRGNEIAMIFQEPMTSLNPVLTVGTQIAETLVEHRGLEAEEAREQVIALLERVGIPSPEQRIDDYAHQLSGGMCQRVMIAMALACDPKLLIADEPTTALDVTVQAQILDLLRELQRELGMSIVLITHDLGVVAEMAQRVVVMYAGEIVERANVRELFARPRHPYTAGLLRSIPLLERVEARLQPIEGSVPDAADFPAGCRFHPRCPYVRDRCRSEAPPERERAAGSGAASHRSACWVIDERPEIDLLADARAGEAGS